MRARSAGYKPELLPRIGLWSALREPKRKLQKGALCPPIPPSTSRTPLVSSRRCLTRRSLWPSSARSCRASWPGCRWSTSTGSTPMVTSSHPACTSGSELVSRPSTGETETTPIWSGNPTPPKVMAATPMWIARSMPTSTPPDPRGVHSVAVRFMSSMDTMSPEGVSSKTTTSSTRRSVGSSGSSRTLRVSSAALCG